MAKKSPEEPRNTDETDLIARTKKYAFLKSQLDYLEKEQKALRALLFEDLDEIGEEDDKGNVIIELPEEVEGYSSVVKQRRVSRKIDEALAEEIIIKHGLEDVLYKTIRVVDEDALMAALYEDVLTEEEVDEMYPQSITWALVLKK
jgi:RNase H-fold protein (predicted Holliday junction resolvase)